MQLRHGMARGTALGLGKCKEESKLSASHAPQDCHTERRGSHKGVPVGNLSKFSQRITTDAKLANDEGCG